MHTRIRSDTHTYTTHMQASIHTVVNTHIHTQRLTYIKCIHATSHTHIHTHLSHQAVIYAYIQARQHTLTAPNKREGRHACIQL